MRTSYSFLPALSASLLCFCFFLFYSSDGSIVDGLFILSLFIFHFKLFHFSRFTWAKPRKVLVVFVIVIVVVVRVSLSFAQSHANDGLGKRNPHVRFSLVLMGFDNNAGAHCSTLSMGISTKNFDDFSIFVRSIVTATIGDGDGDLTVETRVGYIHLALFHPNANCQQHFGRKFLFNMIQLIRTAYPFDDFRCLASNFILISFRLLFFQLKCVSVAAP